MKVPRHSTVVSYAALFIALGGTSYAAIKLPANSVGSREIKPRSVQTSDLALTSRLSKNNRVFRAAVTDTLLDPNTQAVVDALGAAVKGEKGDAGPAGAPGPLGGIGPAGLSGYAMHDAYSGTVDAGQQGAAVAKCDSGERIIAGGGRFEGDGTSAAFLMDSYPEHFAEGDNWFVKYANGITGTSTSSGRVHVFALCAKAS